MFTPKRHFIYITTNSTNQVLYTGVTSNLIHRAYQHQRRTVSSFTEKYIVTKLVYFEEHPTMIDAIKREKQIKGGSRQKKLNLIKSMNPNFDDLLPKLLT